MKVGGHVTGAPLTNSAPNEDKSALTLDLIGHLEDTRQMSDKTGIGKLFNPNAPLNDDQQAEIERASEFAGSFGFRGKESVVAGAGFEPATFRL